mmetsp:Transcript_37868/g.64652  ORF Transcript_37868/g.64652 Transcript_37868/m.64652 type:complete len:658 (-) Transcript_37868:350-2323(-)
MVAILVRKICNNIVEMKRHKGPNDDSDHSGASNNMPPRQDDARSSPRQPRVVEESRDPQASATASAPMSDTVSVNVTMSDSTHNHPGRTASASFDHRDERRSAFRSVLRSESDEIAPKAKAAEQHQDQQQRKGKSRSTSPRPHPVDVGLAEEQDPLPYQSPLRYYHQHPPPPRRTASEGEEANPDPDPEATQAPYHYHQYPGYPPSYHDYNYSGYYHSHSQESDTASRQQYHQPHPSYHHQDFNTTNYPQGYSSDPYPYYPSAGSAHHPPYPSQYSQPYSQQYHQNYPGSPSPSNRPDTLRETPSAVTESTKGTSATITITPSMAHKTGGSTGEEGLDLSPSVSMEEDDRKQPPVSSAGSTGNVRGPLKGILKKESPPAPRPQGHHDFEPIPLKEIAAIPVLSTKPSRSSHPPSPTYPDAATTAAATASSSSASNTTRDPFHGAFPTSYRRTRSSRAYTSSSSRGPSSSSPVAPPVPRSTQVARRTEQHRTLLAPSSSGSVASGGGEGGSWERRFGELIEFKRIHGHCEVPQNYAENTSLGTWVNKQRMEQKNRIEGKNSSLNDARLERLQSIDFRWAKRKGQASWDEKFNELVAYKAKFGNCHVPTKYKNNTALGRWVSTQRAEYKKYQEGQAKTSMNADKIRRLEAIGFAWFMAL